MNEAALARTTAAWGERLQRTKASKKRWRRSNGSRPARESFRTRPDIITRNESGSWGLNEPGGGWKEIIAVEDLCRVMVDDWENNGGRKSGKVAFIGKFMSKYLAANKDDLEFIIDTFIKEKRNCGKSNDTEIIATPPITCNTGTDCRISEIRKETPEIQRFGAAAENNNHHSISWLRNSPSKCNGPCCDAQQTSPVISSVDSVTFRNEVGGSLPLGFNCTLHRLQGTPTEPHEGSRRTQSCTQTSERHLERELQLERWKFRKQIQAKNDHTLSTSQIRNKEKFKSTRKEVSKMSFLEISLPLSSSSLSLPDARLHDELQKKSSSRQRATHSRSAIFPNPQSKTSRSSPKPVWQRKPGGQIFPLCGNLQHQPTQLCSSYFSRTCSLLSTFDSPLNPFRSTISSMMADSNTIYLLVQALAAAHAHTHYSLGPEVLNLQAQAFVAANQDIVKVSDVTLQISNTLMLSIVLLGSTTAWFNAADTGIIHLDGAWAMFTRWLHGKADQLDFESSFVLGFFVYWQMTAAFVTTAPDIHFARQDFLQTILRKQILLRKTPINGKQPTRILVPHPSTGFSAELYLCVGKIGSLGRIRTLKEGALSGTQFTDRYMQQARALETYLLGWERPDIDTTADIMDAQTPVTHILTLMEAYRCAGILQLYTVVPELLQKRLPLDMLAYLGVRTQDFANVSLSLGISMPSDSVRKFTSVEHQLLQKIAFRILELLRELPVTSGTRTIQPILLLISGAWVTQYNSSSIYANANEQVPVLQSIGDVEDEDPIAYWRNFIRSRYEANRSFLGVAPYSKIEQILEGTWEAADANNEDCCWMSIMARMGWETLLG